ncbi:hypothetical protein [Nocardia higoensis]|uniref:hypothetical protein n=1 Tax=Nocardia higoensis TaxID=228599 RepID=UPI0003200DD2|nr:hypothetical protein [Nocardia higoensis]
MRHTAVVVPPLRLGASDSRRLRDYGLLPVHGDTGPAAANSPAAALLSTAPNGSLITVAGLRDDPDPWRHAGPAILAEATASAAATVTSRALAVVLLPAVETPMPGPVAVLSPAGSVSSYEVHLGAALAAHAGRRVEHINARGAASSALHNGLPARAAARTAVPDWREIANPRPERSLHRLTSRPSLIVAPVPPGTAEAATLVADHPDADIVLVFDAVHARYGADLARQVSSMVELALGVELSGPADETPAAPDDGAATRSGNDPATPSNTTSRAPADALPPVRASDVIHVRLTDTALELTNRSRQRIRCRIGLGSADSGARVRAVFSTPLGPGEAHVEPTDPVAELAGLSSPEAVLRTWSHSRAEVYEGGERRMLDLEITVLDEHGTERARRTYTAPNGLDFSVTGRDLSTLLGRESPMATPASPASTRPPVVPARDILTALRSALDTGASVLARRSG